MPVAQFPGRRNWGYDGAYPFAVQNSYGGPDGLKRLVDACHQRGLAVVLDVVYNHLGPEGNYLGQFGPYFTERYRTPWGAALNFDGPDSDEVRRFFLENALYWQREFHLDGLRLDAADAIQDFSPAPFLRELAESTRRRAERLGRRFHLIAESDRNDVRYLLPAGQGGLGLDAQWSDDFHRALHALLTDERNSYFQDFGRVEDLARAYRDGFVFTGQYCPFRRRRHGSSSRERPASQFVVYAQNHDQVGNRPGGERLAQLAGLPGLKLAAAAVLLSPYLPLLFMGEEYGETTPFRFFTSHDDEPLARRVQQGREKGYAYHGWRGGSANPQEEDTFVASRLFRQRLQQESHRTLRAFYKQLLWLRKMIPALARLSKEHQEVVALEGARTLYVRRWADRSEVFFVMNFGATHNPVSLPVPPGAWVRMLDSADPQWLGGGSELPQRFDSPGEVTLTLSPVTCALYVRVE
jgi:maltooligosyltrehalose trehalohydrolase